MTITPGTFDAAVSWSPGYDGGHPQQFSLRYKKVGSENWELLDVRDESRKVLSYLHLDTQYEFIIQSRNALGPGFETPTIYARTKG